MASSRSLPSASAVDMAPLPTYALQSGAGDRNRLLPLADLFDRGTISHLTVLGIHEGWRCLEIGAGCGSIARWMCDQVGASGKVVATDLDTSLLMEVDRPNLEVRRHDLMHEPIEADAFDCVHARLVLEHLPDPEVALAKLVHAVRPGGWLLLEDLDWDAVHPASQNGAEVFRRVSAAMRALWSRGGYNATLGSHLPHLLHQYGLEQINAEGRVRLLVGSTPHAATFFEDVLQQLAPLFLQLHLLTREEILRGIAWARNPGCIGVPAMLVATWGRRPTSSPSMPGAGDPNSERCNYHGSQKP